MSLPLPRPAGKKENADCRIVRFLLSLGESPSWPGMSAFWGSIRKRLFGISLEEVSFTRLGFRGNPGEARQRLERVPIAFATGYHAALEDDREEPLLTKLNTVDLEQRGFAFEGAAMGLALLDYLTPWRRNRVASFLRGAGAAHAYMVHVGVGWAMARLHAGIPRARARLDPLLGWLAIDGYGFHEGFFHWPRYIEGQPAPSRLRGYDHRAFDQGLGRSLWFVEGADVTRIPRTLTAFATERRADLWRGIGLAATYAGGVGEAELKALREAASASRPQLAQGSAFAAKARQRAGNLVPHTELACRTLCGLSAEEAARLTDVALESLSPDDFGKYKM